MSPGTAICRWKEAREKAAIPRIARRSTRLA